MSAPSLWSALRAVAWMRWRVLLSTLHSRSDRLGLALSSMLGLIIFSLALAFGLGMFLLLYLSMRGGASDVGGMSAERLLINLLVPIYLFWTLGVLMPSRQGQVLEASRLLHYPISLPRLFFLDLLAEAAGGAFVLLTPTVVGIHLGVGLATGHVLQVLPLLLMTLGMGLALTKFLEAVLALFQRRGKSQGEWASALAGLAFAALMVVGANLGPSLQKAILGSVGVVATVVRSLPPVLTARGLFALAKGDPLSWGLSCVGLLGYLGLMLLLSGGLWRYVLLKAGGTRSPGERLERPARPWQLPLVSNPMSALLEKELKYLWRNPQVRMLALVPLILLASKYVVLMPNETFEKSDERPLQLFQALRRYLEGDGSPLTQGMALTGLLAYMLLLYSGAFNNLFGLDGRGMRAYLLTPVSRKSLILAKNLAVTLMLLVQLIALLLLDAVFFRDLGWESLAILPPLFLGATLSMTASGTLVSLYFPAASPYGRRLEAHRWASLICIPQVPLALLPAGLAFLLGLAFESLLLKHGILWGSCGLLLGMWWRGILPLSEQLMEDRECEVAAAVIGDPE